MEGNVGSKPVPFAHHKVPESTYKDVVSCLLKVFGQWLVSRQVFCLFDLLFVWKIHLTAFVSA